MNLKFKYICLLSLLGILFFGPLLDAEDEEEMSEVKAELTHLLASPEVHDLKNFVRSEISPDIWGLIEQSAVHDPWRSLELIEYLTEVREDYFFLKEQTGEQSVKFLEYHRLEVNSRILGEKIRSQPVKSKEVEQWTAELEMTLRRAFALKLQMQELELKNLEAEVSELRDLLKKRSESRDRIIERRLKELVGEEDELEW